MLMTLLLRELLYLCHYFCLVYSRHIIFIIFNGLHILNVFDRYEFVFQGPDTFEYLTIRSFIKFFQSYQRIILEQILQVVDFFFCLDMFITAALFSYHRFLI